MAGFTVTSDQDDEQAPPPGSLRQAILDANGNPGPDTINFTVTGTILLSAPLPASRTRVVRSCLEEPQRLPYRYLPVT